MERIKERPQLSKRYLMPVDVIAHHPCGDVTLKYGLETKNNMIRINPLSTTLFPATRVCDALNAEWRKEQEDKDAQIEELKEQYKKLKSTSDGYKVSVMAKQERAEQAEEQRDLLQDKHLNAQSEIRRIIVQRDQAHKWAIHWGRRASTQSPDKIREWNKYLAEITLELAPPPEPEPLRYYTDGYFVRDRLAPTRAVITCPTKSLAVDICDLLSALESKEAEVVRLRKAGLRVLDIYEGNLDCTHIDHHGYCQSHNLDPVEDCWMKQLRQALADSPDARKERKDA